MKSKFIKKYVESTFISDDAPSDGNAYLRHNNNWKFIETPISSISDAPSDGNIYDRKDNSWLVQDPRTNLITSQIIGVELVSPGGGSGTWRNIDVDGNPVTFLNNIQRKAYFDNHPIWGNIKEEIIDGQYMVRIPKFYFKNDNHQKIWISPYKVNDTFKCHPAFMKNGEEMDCFWIGKYQGSVSNNKLCSVPGVNPTQNTTMSSFRTCATNRNTNGIDGFQIIDIYKISAIQSLFLIEYSTTDSQAIIGVGNSNKYGQTNGVELVDSATNLGTEWRGMVALWGNIWQGCDGLEVRNGEIWIYDNQGFNNYVQTSVSQTKTVQWSYIYTCCTVKDDSSNYDLTDIFLSDQSTQVSSISSGTYSDCTAWGTSTSEIYEIGWGGAWGSSSGNITFSGIFAINLTAKQNTYGLYQGSRLAKI